MSWFNKLFGWFSSFFITFSKTAIAQMAEELAPKIKNTVALLENEEIEGVEKAKYVKKFVRDSLALDLRTVVINTAIHMCLAVIREESK